MQLCFLSAALCGLNRRIVVLLMKRLERCSTGVTNARITKTPSSLSATNNWQSRLALLKLFGVILRINF